MVEKIDTGGHVTGSALCRKSVFWIFERESMAEAGDGGVLRMMGY